MRDGFLDQVNINNRYFLRKFVCLNHFNCSSMNKIDTDDLDWSQWSQPFYFIESNAFFSGKRPVCL